MTGGLTFPHPNIEGALLLSRLSRQGGDFDLLKIMDSAEVKSPVLVPAKDAGTRTGQPEFVFVGKGCASHHMPEVTAAISLCTCGTDISCPLPLTVVSAEMEYGASRHSRTTVEERQPSVPRKIPTQSGELRPQSTTCSRGEKPLPDEKCGFKPSRP